MKTLIVTPALVGQTFSKYADDTAWCETIAHLASAPNKSALMSTCFGFVVWHYPRQARTLPDYVASAMQYVQGGGTDIRLWVALVRWIDALERGELRLVQDTPHQKVVQASAHL